MTKTTAAAASKSLAELRCEIVDCRRCPRLVEHREHVQAIKTKRFANQSYWGKPVPAFGGSQARLLVLGLAPAAHGANRTGRMFTGDRSGDWLYEALHLFGFASQAESRDRDDGLFLIDTFITAVVRCAPPGNKPDTLELENCRVYLVRELGLMDRVQVVVALGRIAFEGFLAAWRAAGCTVPSPKPKFSHESRTFLEGPKGKVLLIGSYHPSQQNTFTGRLTQQMFHQIFRGVRRNFDKVDAKRPS